MRSRKKGHKKLKSVNNYSEDHFHHKQLDDKNFSEQSIPKKWKQILEMKDKFKRNLKSKNRKKKNKNELICLRTESEPIEKGMTRSDKPLPQLIEQGLYESEYHFMNRLSKLSAKAKAEANIEERFDVDFCEKLDTTDDYLNDISKDKNKKLKTKKLKHLKRKPKKRITSKDNNSFGHLKDEIQFGERVNEPPILDSFKFKNRNKIYKK